MEYRVEETAAYLVYRVGRLMRFRAARFFRDRGIDMSPEQWGVLLMVRDKGRPVLSDLVDSVLGDHPNVTRLVAGLERMGHVRRVPNPGDRRSWVVEATDQGRDFVREVLPGLIEAKCEYFNGLDRGEVAELVRMLKLVQGNLQE